ncbi:MAG: hypothetical protein Q8R88_17195 [Desulfoprunum sp.]|nr:hypothetical protein [Desulfoprunum sp.]
MVLWCGSTPPSAAITKYRSILRTLKSKWHDWTMKATSMLAAIICKSTFSPADLRRRKVFLGNTSWIIAAVSLCGEDITDTKS